jgi:cytochrome c oxidase subunit 2
MSALDPAGVDAAVIARLFWIMAAGGAVIFAGMVALMLYCFRATRVTNATRASTWLIVGGGVVLPTVVLISLLTYGLRGLPQLIDAPRADALTIEVAGEQWWWRVRYRTPAGAVDLANEIRLPVGLRTEVLLSSANVIHAFWIPSLAGKVDMIPGRATHLSLQPTRAGTFRGACAEYCGTAHALMAFDVVAMERAEFDDWLARQAQPAATAVSDVQRLGERMFHSSGCGSCHAIRGSDADGTVGPDLTHVGGRLSVGAATRPNHHAEMTAWIGNPERIKPGAHMPQFAALGDDTLRAIASYLLELR